MAFLYADSWESLTAIGDTSVRGWTNSGTPVLETTVVKDNTNSISLDNSDSIERDLVHVDILFVSFWIRRTHTTQATFFRAQGTSGSSDEFSLRAETDDTIDVILPGGATLGSSAAVFTIDTWHHIEFKMRMNASTTAADIQLKVNGVLEVDDAGGTDSLVTDTTVTKIIFDSGGVASEFMYVDSPVLWDNQGGTAWNVFRGMLRIEVLFPTGEGNDNSWVGSDSNSVDNYLHVDDPALNDGGSSFNESNVLNAQDLHSFGNLTGDIATIAGVQDVLIAERSSGPARSVTNLYRGGSTDYLGSANALTAGVYNDYYHMWDQDPDTGPADWTESGVNAAEFGVEVTT